MPRAQVKMLTLAMRREEEDSKGDGYARQRDTASSAAEEFVDILQVQQLLLDSGGAPANGGRTRERGREPPPPPSDPRSRLLDAAALAAAAPPSYYYGSYGTHHTTPPAASVDDLVALWFAGPSTSGLSPCVSCLHHPSMCLHFCSMLPPVILPLNLMFIASEIGMLSNIDNLSKETRVLQQMDGFRLPFVRTKSLVFITVYVVYFKCTKYMKQTCTVNSS